MDLDALKKQIGQSPEEILTSARRTATLFRRLWSFPKPLIAAVNGAALAGGCGIATLCDFTFAATEATFGYTEVRVGFMPALVSMFLECLVGEKVARDLLLTGRFCDATEAKSLGLVTRVVAAEELLPAARELAATLVALSPGSLAATKRLLVRSSEAEIDRRISLAIAESTAIRSTEDYREGLAAFLEKRKPRWTGR
jgi:methylglutaconyl-CoA hydratase